MNLHTRDILGTGRQQPRVRVVSFADDTYLLVNGAVNFDLAGHDHHAQLGCDQRNQVATITKDDPKMDIGYSMLVRQYPLDQQAYTYWLNVQKNSQSLGGLFDLQPGQLPGNIHGVTNPKDPVVGYVSACSIAEKRIFISNSQLPGMAVEPFGGLSD